MKNKRIPTPAPAWKSLAAIAIAAGVSLGPAVLRADTEWEYEADEGYHEEEWYDPTDWLNEDNEISYESDSYDTRGYDSYSPYGYGYAWTYDVTPYYDRDEADGATTSSNNRQEDRNQNASSDNNRDNRSHSLENARFDGRIEGFKTVNLKSRRGSEEHSLVKIRLQNDQSRVVSLGSNVDLDTLDLEKGERIQVSGPVARVGDKKVLLADRIRVGNETFRVKDKNQLHPRENRSRHGGPATVEGTLEDFRRLKMGNSNDSKLFVRLEMKDGGTEVVDLGKNTSLDELGLEQGDRIRVNGDRREISRTVIVARGITVDGEKTRIREHQDTDSTASRD